MKLIGEKYLHTICISMILQLKSGQGTPVTFYLFCLFVCFVALHPKSTAMVMAGRSVHLTTLFPGQT